MHFEIFHHLPKQAVFIRQTVFVQEQGFVEEFDQTDQTATHIVLYQNDLPAATCRFFYDAQKQSYIVGRIAVLKQFRGQRLGAAVLRRAEQEIAALGGRQAYLAAQTRAMGFYQKQGYAPQGDEFLEETCPHIWMQKSL